MFHHLAHIAGVCSNVFKIALRNFLFPHTSHIVIYLNLYIIRYINQCRGSYG